MKLFILALSMGFTVSSFAHVQAYVEVSDQESKFFQKAVYERVSQALFQCERTEGKETYPEFLYDVASLFKYYLQMGQTKVYVQKNAQPVLRFVFKSAMTTQESFITTWKNSTAIESLTINSTSTNSELNYKIECHYR